MALFDRLKEAQGSDEYVSPAKLNIYGQMQNDEVEHDKTVNIPFNIDAEYRSWGIGQLSLLATATIDVPYSRIKYDEKGDEVGREEQTLKLDLSTAETEWIPGGYFGIKELDISLTETGGIANAKLVCVYIKKDGE